MGATWRCCSDSSAPDSRSSISPTMPIRARWKAEECWKSRLCQRRCCAKFMTLLAALTNLQPCGRGDEARHHKFWAGARVLPDKSRKMYTAKPQEHSTKQNGSCGHGLEYDHGARAEANAPDFRRGGR